MVDLFNREIVAYVVSHRANSDMVETMLHKACRQRNDAACTPTKAYYIVRQGIGTYVRPFHGSKHVAQGNRRSDAV